MTNDEWLTDTRTSYDTVASSYADQMRDALDGQKFLHAALGLFVDAVRAGGGGKAVDVGCGPGHVTAHLHAAGLDVFGLDLSPAMTRVASREYPAVRFVAGSMTDLPFADASISGLLAFWSLVHVPDEALPVVFADFGRVLRPGAPLLLGFHFGDTSILKTEGYGGHPMKVHVYRRRPADLSAGLREAGFEVEAHLLLGPDAERPGAVVFARRLEEDRKPAHA